MTGTVNIAVVGLNFGASFVPSYKHHPQVGEVTICDFNQHLVSQVGERWDITKRAHSLQSVLDDPDINAVHLLTNITGHADQAVAVLEAGKHCAVAVPMALTMEDVARIVAAQEKSRKVYMLAETVIFTRNFLYVQQLLKTGQMGNIQFMRGAHYQDVDGWPSYWKGMPPMYYATHALAPAFAATGSRAKRVVCFGSGKMREQLHEPYGNPHPMQTALFQMEDGTLAEVTRTLFHNPRGYTEAFTIGGDNITFETGQLDADRPVMWRYKDDGVFDPDMKLTTYTTMGREVTEERIDPPDQLHLIPEPIHKYTRSHTVTSLRDPEDVFEYTTIGGFHPHLVHEFINAAAGQRTPEFDIYRAADLTAACLAAHDSAMADGSDTVIREFLPIS
ncbi:Gfo/Idh/MocA family oxidoreductase (plasmid) [Arthrobacter sp. D3-18]